MAIQVYRTSQNFNSPIGVAGVSQAPTRLANAFSQVTENIAQMQYKVDVRKQEEQALDTVSQMSLRETDENDPTGRGTLVFKKLPESFSPVQRRAVQETLDKMYAQQIQFDVQYKTAELAREYKNDPEGFLKALSSWQEGYTSAENIGKYKPLVDISVSQYGLQHANALYVDKANLEERQAFNTEVGLLDGDINDLESGIQGLAEQPFFYIGQGDDQVTLTNTEALSNYKEKLISQVNEIYESYPTRYSSDNRDRDLRRIEKAFATVPVTRAVNAIANAQYSSDLEYDRQLKEASLNDIALALRGVSISPQSMEILTQFGFDKDYLTSTPFIIRKDIASDITTIANTISENETLRRDLKQSILTQEKITNNVSVTPTEVENYLKVGLGIQTPNDLYRVLFSEQGLDDRGSPLYKLMFNQQQDLPQVFKDFFKQDNILRLISNNQQDATGLVRFYNSLTRTQNNQFLYRGLSDNSIELMTSIELLSQTAQVADIPEVLRRLNDPNINVKQTFESQMGEDFKTLDEYITKEFTYDTYAIGDERGLTPAEDNYVRASLPKLVAVYGKELGTDIMRQSLSNRFYRKGSRFMVPEFNVSQFAPERLYGEKGDDIQEFQRQAEVVLSLMDDTSKKIFLNGQEPVFGENVFVAEPRNVSGAYPTYTLVDEFSRPIIVMGTVLQVNRAGMIKHHRDLANERNRDLTRFNELAQKGPYTPTLSSNVQQQADEIGANESRKPMMSWRELGRLITPNFFGD